MSSFFWIFPRYRAKTTWIFSRYARGDPDIFALTREKPGYFRAAREIHLDILALRAAVFVFAGNQHIAACFASLQVCSCVSHAAAQNHASVATTSIFCVCVSKRDLRRIPRYFRIRFLKSLRETVYNTSGVCMSDRALTSSVTAAPERSCHAHS